MGVTSRDREGERGRATASDECAAIESRLATSAQTGSGHDGEHVYWHVLLSLRRWLNGNGDASEATVERRLRRSIRRDLRRTGHRSAADSVARPKKTDYCDIVVDERIGLKIVHNLTSRSREWMHKQLRSLLREYDYLILYGHRISPGTIDVWRQLKRSLARAASDERRFHAIGTIRRDQCRTATEPAASGASRWPFAVGLVVFVTAAGTTAFVATENVGAGPSFEAGPSLSTIVVASTAVLLLCALLAGYLGRRSS